MKTLLIASLLILCSCSNSQGIKPVQNTMDEIRGKTDFPNYKITEHYSDGHTCYVVESPSRAVGISCY